MILVLVLFLAQFGVNADGSYESETDSAFDSGHEITPEGDETPSSIGEGGESSGVSEASPESEAPITGEALTESFSSHSSSTTTVLVSETLAITESLTEAAPEGASLILDESSNEVASEGGSFVVSTISIGESSVPTVSEATAMPSESLTMLAPPTLSVTPSSTVSPTPSSTVSSTPSSTVSLTPTASSSSTISQTPSLSIRTRTPSASSTPTSSQSYRPVNVSGGTVNLTSVGENETILIGGTGIVGAGGAANLTLAGIVLEPDANITFAFNLILTTQLELSGGQIISAARDHELTFKNSAEIKFDSPGGVLGRIGLGFVAQGNEEGSIPGKIEVSISRSSLTTTSLADFSHVLVYGLHWDIGCKLWLPNVVLSDTKQFDRRCVNNRDSWYGRLLAGSQTNLEIFGIVEKKSKTGMIIGIVVAVVVVLAVVIAVVVTRRRRVKFSASTETFTRTESTETFSPSEYSTNEELERIDEA